jgi:hypothetical protein
MDYKLLEEITQLTKSKRDCLKKVKLIESILWENKENLDIVSLRKLLFSCVSVEKRLIKNREKWLDNYLMEEHDYLTLKNTLSDSKIYLKLLIKAPNPDNWFKTLCDLA